MELMQKLREIEASYKEIEARMADPEVANDPREMQSLGKKHVDLTPIVDAFMQYLERNKINARLRRSRGKDIDAACGQLANVNHPSK